MIYSESYYGNLFQAIYNNIGDTHVLPLFQAFEMLLVDNYESFILTININTVDRLYLKQDMAVLKCLIHTVEIVMEWMTLVGRAFY